MARVFIIDDDPILRKILFKMLKNYDEQLDVTCYEDGVEAIADLKSVTEMPELIFLDINMPIMNAWEFVETYDSLELPRVPIYILSSSIDQRDISRASSLELIMDYIIKPMKREVLHQICKEVFES